MHFSSHRQIKCRASFVLRFRWNTTISSLLLDFVVKRKWKNSQKRGDDEEKEFKWQIYVCQDRELVWAHCTVWCCDDYCEFCSTWCQYRICFFFVSVCIWVLCMHQIFDANFRLCFHDILQINQFKWNIYVKECEQRNPTNEFMWAERKYVLVKWYLYTQSYRVPTGLTLKKK